MRSLTQARIMRAKKWNDATLRAAQGCINFRFRKTARLLSQFYDEALRPAGLRSTQFTMLVVIEAAQPLSMSDLAHHLVMDRSTLTRNFGVLEQQGLVSIKVGKDRRSRLVRLARKGRSALTRALPYWQKAQQQVLGRIARKELQALVNAIQSLERMNGSG
jgi:DNA-binding MarR family transcriptional regulator